MPDICPTCRRPLDELDSKRCPNANPDGGNAEHCWRLGLEVRDAELDLLRGQQTKTKTLLERILQQVNDGVALIDQGEDLPRYQTPEMTTARIEAQDRRNAEMALKLARLGDPVEDGADRLLVVVKEGVYGGQPTVGHSRLPLAQIIGMIRNGETIAGLKNCWGGYPDQFWRVCIALAKELMPVDAGTTLIPWTPVAPGNMPDDDTRVFFWHTRPLKSAWRMKHGYFHTHNGDHFDDDADSDGTEHIPASEVSHWAPWPENEPEAARG